LPNEDPKLDSLRPESGEMERGRSKGQNFQLESSAPGKRRRRRRRRKVDLHNFVKAPKKKAMRHCETTGSLQVSSTAASLIM
jgi:hypothetical protein